MTDNNAPETAKMEEGIINEAVPTTTASTSSAHGSESKRLSTVSKMYDLRGDGKLDEAELAMRNMDQTGRGYLTNDKVYALMQEQLAMQKNMFKMKKVIIGLVALVVILALANLGTSFASAILAKDTTTNNKGELVDKKTDQAVATAQAVNSYESKEPDSALRKLAGSSSYATSESDFTIMSASDARSLLADCKPPHHIIVQLRYTWLNGDIDYRTICDPGWGCRSKIKGGGTRGELCIDGTSPVEYVYVDPHPTESDLYTISSNPTVVATADSLTSDAGQLCYDDGDCDAGLECVVEPGFESTQAWPTSCSSSGDCPAPPDTMNVCSSPVDIPDTDDVEYGSCSFCDVNGNVADYCTDTVKTPQCIQKQINDTTYQVAYCGCDETDPTSCGAGLTCGQSDCIPDIPAFCSSNHNAEHGCGKCQEPGLERVSEPGVADEAIEGLECSRDANSCGNDLYYCQFASGDRCLDDVTGTCALKPGDVCPLNIEYVQGCDGITHSNACSAVAAGFDTVQCDPSTPCDDGYYCKYDANGCGADGTPGVCAKRTDGHGCEKILSYVCGCDGFTYDNECTASHGYLNGAQTMVGTSIDFPGTCGSEPEVGKGPAIEICSIDQPCQGDDGTVYCKYDDGVNCRDDGTFGVCTSTSGLVCPDFVEEPQPCGCDGNFHSTECHANAVGVAIDFSGNSCPAPECDVCP